LSDSGLAWCQTRFSLVGMLSKFEKTVADFIRTNKMFCSSERVLLAVSGGGDSIALLHCLCALSRGEVLDTNFLCAHINHQLRASDADTDEKFVVQQALQLGLPVVTSRIDVRRFAADNKLSIETAGRILRLEKLQEMATEHNCTAIATGHQKDDNAETVIQRLARGTGLRGLGGIWPVRRFGDGTRFVRPLLCVGREEIIEYLGAKGVAWCTDHTNADCSYRRNFIRHRLMPALQKQCSDSVPQMLMELSRHCRRFYAMVCERADAAWTRLADCSDQRVSLNLRHFSAEHPAVKAELFRRALVRLGSGERDLTQRHYQAVLDLASAKSVGGKTELPGGFVALREYNKLVFSRSGEPALTEKAPAEAAKIEVPGQTRYGEYVIEARVLETVPSTADVKRKAAPARVERFDLEELKLPLFVRGRRTGDKFVPLGMTAEKKVGKFLTSQKVPESIRRQVLVIEDAEKIVWLWPIRMSEQAKVTSTTTKVLELRITDSRSQ